ncbi:mitochondrial calcium uniporter regulator 1 isoform X1 [Chanos chanos]|uniref:Mitochondrial calcium uniporter regulator 1 isoform X1 n=1 Tax=Chanos chanos TaxID=29144 RepID=A0A6J2VV12_CHACN|nr:mitochondrial calcium uniporter regulator 1-like isoform X1 [Chanos chanos]
MILRGSNNVVFLNSLGSINKNVAQSLDFRKTTQRRTKAKPCIASLGQYLSPVITSAPQPLNVLRRHCLRLIFWPVYKLAVSSEFTPPWPVSSGISKMLSLCGMGKVHLNYSFGNRIRTLHCKRFLSSDKDTAILWRRTRLLVRELSTSIKALQLDLRRSDMAKSSSRKFFFDTHAIVRLLEQSGFTTQQAEVVVAVMVKTTNSNMDVLYNDMVTKTQQEIMLQKVMSEIAAVKKDMIILEKSEFSTLLAENEKIKVELMQLKMQLVDVMNKVRSESILDMNMEKSRVREMKADHERKLLEAKNEMMEMNAEQERHVTQTNVRIDTEVAGLKTMLESHKLDTIKYLAGSVFTCLTVVLGFYRIWM